MRELHGCTHGTLTVFEERWMDESWEEVHSKTRIFFSNRFVMLKLTGPLTHFFQDKVWRATNTAFGLDCNLGARSNMHEGYAP